MGSFSQLPGILNIQGVSGNDLSIGLNFGMNLTGYSFAANVKTGPPTPLVVTVTNAAAGQVNITVPAAVSSALPGKNTWELDWTDPGSLTRTILSGNFWFNS